MKNSGNGEVRNEEGSKEEAKGGDGNPPTKGTTNKTRFVTAAGRRQHSHTRDMKSGEFARAN